MAERDLGRMLAALRVRRRPGVFVFVSLEASTGSADVRTAVLAEAAHATIVEDEGTTFVVEEASAARAGFGGSFRAAWLTLEVFSALDAVGLTAAVSAALTEVGVSCNVLAGTHHDHLLVPVDDADRALEALAALRERRWPTTRTGSSEA